MLPNFIYFFLFNIITTKYRTKIIKIEVHTTLQNGHINIHQKQRKHTFKYCLFSVVGLYVIFRFESFTVHL